MDSKIKVLNDKIAEAHLGGGKKRIENNIRIKN
jgi:propionyl-CoA carboxylase beta chain